ncbi:hypothetical protein MJT46_007735 [Ovis ammon polii x Ovis aries]|nr:hypothetical protein MJT46_007735 [Ovis ammon polii x Ovis aries]
MRLVTGITLLLALGVSAQQLNQSPQSMSIQEGEDLSMNCNSSSTLNLLLWYKQDAGEGLILLIKLLKGGPRRADWIRSQESEVPGTEGKTVSLFCNYYTSSRSFVSLFWYRQYPNQAPEYILYRQWGSSGKGYASFATERFYSDNTANTTNLYIKKVVPADTALYLCALERHKENTA